VNSTQPSPSTKAVTAEAVTSSVAPAAPTLAPVIADAATVPPIVFWFAVVSAITPPVTATPLMPTVSVASFAAVDAGLAVRNSAAVTMNASACRS
jgi:hypothetical protein